MEAVVDLASLRARLAATTGRRYWRSLEELADSEEFLELLHKEFPRQAAPLLADLDRRQFLKLMGASLALAGLAGCTRQPTETIVPYVRMPEGIVPGQPLYFATAIPIGAVATGVLVESHVGRPTKIEGNPLHPASLGATDALVQASVLALYDPDRSQVVRHVDEILPWAAFDDAIGATVEAQARAQGAGLRILTGSVTSPTLAGQLREILARFPGARWHQYEPVSRDAARLGSRIAFGRPLDPVYRFERADVVLSLDADFLGSGAGVARYIRDFVSRRRLRDGSAEMNRLYVAESTPTSTGAKADERLPLRASEIEGFTRALAGALGLAVAGSDGGGPRAAWLDAVAADLAAHRGRSLVVAGGEQPPAVHALAYAINAKLGNLGETLVLIEPVDEEPVDQTDSLRALVADMRSGAVEVLLILGGNPVYDAPADFDFAGALDAVRLRIHLGLYDDETSRLCHWHLPEAHALESWGDARAYDGTVTILQPLIAPLYGGRSSHEVLATVAGSAERSGYEILRAAWQVRAGGGDFERFWKRALNDGLVAGSARSPRTAALRSDWAAAIGDAPPPAAQAGGDLEIVFRPDPAVLDGRFANNGWLQELPRPQTKLTWDNVAALAPATAERLGVRSGDVIELVVGDRRVAGPAWILPGHAPDSVTVTLGYGRTHAGQVGNDVGFDVYRIRTSDAPWFATGLEIRKTGETRKLACTQDHHSLEGRAIVRTATLDEYRGDPDFAGKMGDSPPLDDTLYPNHPYDGAAWGMAVDLNACVGCNACIVACQSENNIPVVGREQVAMGREMQWIRVDRYWSGDLEDPRTDYQPMLCQHCERAPCEVVCPVNATVHDREGLNVMVYNRCVGTRYCSNNCPYKVRRFNFFLYQDWETESLKLQRNPDVTVRSRGVMEKCTYCVQRISYGRIQARKESRPVRDGEIVTACQQVCPADAIVFGDVHDPESRVARLKAEPRDYSVLAELNTRPRTTYLASVRNPNPALRGKTDASS
jgi:MoCo/4Fe-4S cofactor protein with predicted Tat translocation signal